MFCSSQSLKYIFYNLIYHLILKISITSAGVNMCQKLFYITKREKLCDFLQL